MTQTINGYVHDIYANNFKNAGIPKTRIRVYDTPGFGDADPDNIYKNRLLERLRIFLFTKGLISFKT